MVRRGPCTERASRKGNGRFVRGSVTADALATFSIAPDNIRCTLTCSERYLELPASERSKPAGWNYGVAPRRRNILRDRGLCWVFDPQALPLHAEELTLSINVTRFHLYLVSEKIHSLTAWYR